MFEKANDKRRYISILGSTGKFHESVPLGTEDSVQREYETKDGKKGTKNELVYQKIRATITSISFEERDFGEQILIGVQGEEGEAIIATNSGNSFAIDIMKKLPNVDFSRPVEIAPYAFEDDNGKNKRGVSILQNGVKLQDYFTSKDADNNWVYKNGFPEVKDRDNMNSKKWQMYFMQVSEFLADYTKNHICAKVNNTPVEKRTVPVDGDQSHSDAIDNAFDEVTAEDIPFIS
jgi:hypothetical protein